MACKHCHKQIVKPADMKVGKVYVLKTDGFGIGQSYKGHRYELVKSFNGFALKDLDDNDCTRTGYNKDIRRVADSRDVFVLGKRTVKREKANAV